MIIGGHTITLDSTAITALGSNSLVSITGNNASSVLSITGTATITVTGAAAITYSSTSTSGFVQVATGQTLTVTSSYGSGGSAVTASGSGYAIITAGTASLTINNTGGTCVTCSSSGRGIQWTSSGTLTITGTTAGTGSSSGSVIRITGTATGSTININGSVSQTANIGSCIYMDANATINLNGEILTTGATFFRPVYMEAGTFNWIGTRSLAASNDILIYVAGGTLNLGTAGTAFTLANSGRFCIIKTGAVTPVQTYSTITLQAATAQASGIGFSLTITGPTIPTEANVVDGVMFGYLAADEGEYPTTAATQEAEYDIVEADKAKIISGEEIAMTHATVTGTGAGGGTVIVVDD